MGSLWVRGRQVVQLVVERSLGILHHALTGPVRIALEDHQTKVLNHILVMNPRQGVERGTITIHDLRWMQDWNSTSEMDIPLIKLK